MRAFLILGLWQMDADLEQLQAELRAKAGGGREIGSMDELEELLGGGA
jgi:hypothetical protein